MRVNNTPLLSPRRNLFPQQLPQWDDLGFWIGLNFREGFGPDAVRFVQPHLDPRSSSFTYFENVFYLQGTNISHLTAGTWEYPRKQTGETSTNQQFLGSMLVFGGIICLLSSAAPIQQESLPLAGPSELQIGRSTKPWCFSGLETTFGFCKNRCKEFRYLFGNEFYELIFLRKSDEILPLARHDFSKTLWNQLKRKTFLCIFGWLFDHFFLEGCDPAPNLYGTSLHGGLEDDHLG